MIRGKTSLYKRFKVSDQVTLLKLILLLRTLTRNTTTISIKKYDFINIPDVIKVSVKPLVDGLFYIVISKTKS